MDQTTTKNKKDIAEWLLGFEKHIGKDCVVSLLISRGNISFLSCMDRKRYLNDDEPDEDEPKINLKSKIKALNVSDFDYVG